MAKNNRSSVNEEEVHMVTSTIGDPDYLAHIGNFETTGEKSVVLLDLRNPDHIEVYEELHNSPDKFDVVDESDYGARNSVLIVVRYLRKGPWKIRLPEYSKKNSSSSQQKGKRTQTATKKKKVAGFASQEG